MKLIKQEQVALDNKVFTVEITGLELAAVHSLLGPSSHGHLVSLIKDNFPTLFDNPDDLEDYELFKEAERIIRSGDN